MLSAIVGASIRWRGVVVSLAFLLAGYGIFALQGMSFDVFPEFAPPQVLVATEARGLSSEQVETLVTQPVEGALGGAAGLVTMRSKSLQGLSLVTLTFPDGEDVYRARQLAAERLATVAGKLPPGVGAPAMLAQSSSTGVALIVGLTSDARSSMDLRNLAQWTIRPRLLGLPGVADVVVFGGDVQQFQVEVDPHKLVRYGLSLQDVIDAARRSTGVRGAGFLEGANQRIVIQSDGQVRTADDLAQTLVRYANGIGVRLGDVARVVIGAAPPVGAASIDGKPGVMLVIESQYRTDTTYVTRSVETALATLKPVLAAERVELQANVFRPADFITTAIGHLRTALLLGAALVVAVLFLFLLDVRAAFISATAIPLSLLCAVVTLRHFGVSLNTMTLGGLAIALGEVVDDAIVDVENILRRLRENRLLENPLPAAGVVLNASMEVRSAVAYVTFIVVLAFTPVLGLSGVAGRLFAPLAIAYILAILASLLVALTLTPALAQMLLVRKSLASGETRFIRWLKGRYARVLLGVDHRTRLIVAMIAVLCIAAVAALPLLNASFIPEMKEGHYIVHMSTAPGTSLAESMRVGGEITAALRAIPGVRLVAQRAGRAADLVDPVGVNTSEFEVGLNPMPGSRQTRVLADIRRALDRFPGLMTSVNTFLTERIDETISGQVAPVVINVFGDDLDVLDAKAQEIARVLGRLPGAAGVSVQAPPGQPQLEISLRRDALSRLGFEPLAVLEAIEAAYQGVDVAQVFQGNRVFAVSVSARGDGAPDATDIGALPLRNLRGTIVPLRELADIRQTTSRYQIEHTGGQRLQTVEAYVKGQPVGDFVAAAKAEIARRVTFPGGTYVAFSGEAEARARAQRDLMASALVAAAGIVLLLYVALRNGRALVLVLVNLPFALVGGVATVLATGGDLSLGSLVGFVTLFGITLRNSIMLISHYAHLVRSEGVEWGAAAARRGASERLVPILMTALVTGLGLLPLVIFSGEPGNEIEGPMAAVILGGLVTSTILNLVALPALASRFGRFARRDPYAAEAAAS